MLEIKYENIEGNLEIYMDCLNAICGEERESMIDLGCCFAPNTPHLKFKKRKYVDVIERQLDHKGEQQYFEKKDILSYEISPLQKPEYQFALSLDCIEHLTEEEGILFLKIIDLIAERQVLFTPLTNLFGIEENSIDPESHKSLWTPDKLESIVPNHYAYITFPDYHKLWNGGAFFFWHTKDIKQDFERVKNILNTKQWHT